jgi:hypothetical protein
MRAARGEITLLLCWKGRLYCERAKLTGRREIDADL